MRELANHILSVAHRSDSPITNLQLQKIMYFTLGFMIQNNISINFARDIFEESPMEAWLYGPVVPEIYETYKKYKSSPIPDEGEISEILEVPQLGLVIRNLIDINPFILVEISHEHRFWDQHRNAIVHTNERPQYTFDDLVEAFNG
ncbi:Panacea domain-containing protein [Macrococcus lamae]|nr:type II toxin-antitoxin system antitoxin SocA domain-containing protein [Macrococcus lamae]